MMQKIGYKHGLMAASVASLLLAGAPGALAADASWTGFKLGLGGGVNVMTGEQYVDSSASSDFSYVGEDSGGYNDSSGAYDDSYGDQSLLAEQFVDLGKAKGFATIELGLDKEFGKRGVIGLVAHYDFGKTTAKSDFAGNGDGTYWFGTNGTWIDGEDEGYSSGGVDIASGSYDGIEQTTEIELGDRFGVGLRLGALSEDRSALYYLAGGWTRAKITQTGTLTFHEMTDNTSGDSYDAEGFAVGAHSSHSVDKSGYFIGAGVEKRLSDKVGVKFEYRYSDYGTVKYTDADAVTGGFGSDVLIGDDAADSGEMHQSADVTDHSLRVLLTFSF